MNEKIIKRLWETNAISIDTGEGFTMASGAKSPIYIDCRKLISFPDVMDEIAVAAESIIEEIGQENIDVLAGGETAGIPYAAWISAKTKIPMIYVRKKPKGYGKSSQIEGVLDEGKKVLLVEDLITTGFSKESFVKGVRDAGAVIGHCVCFFDREQGGAKNLEKLGVKLHSVATLSETLEYGLNEKLISEEEHKIIEDYLD